MFKKSIFAFVIMAVVLVGFSEGAFALTNAYLQKGSAYADLGFTYLTKSLSDGSHRSLPAFDFSGGYAFMDQLAANLKVNYFMGTENYLATKLALQYQLEKPIFEDTWVATEIGFSLRNYMSTSDGGAPAGVTPSTNTNLFGANVGALFSRNFKEVWWGHTGFGLETFSSHNAFNLDLGFEYFTKPNMSLGISLKGNFESSGNSFGPCFALRYHFK